MRIQEIHKLVESGFHEEALKKIKLAKENGETDPILMLFEALALYDNKKDLECLILLNQFLSKINKDHEKYNYALFTSGICLMNLGLAHEASKIFHLVSDEYPDIKKERMQSESQIELQCKAENITKNIFEKVNS